jgi:Thiamine pyrophosphate enzyme, C-terminal TPP binding domain
VQIGEDPLYERYPMRNFPSNLTIKAATGPVLAALEAALAARRPNVDARRKHAEKTSAAMRARWQVEIEAASRKDTITLPWLNHCLHAVLEPNAIVVNEYSFRQEWCPLEDPGSLFSVGSAGGLGWGFPAALGAKLAARDRMVAAFLGDGAYMFANPRPATGWRKSRTCRCWPSFTITRSTMPCAARHWTCIRAASPPARTDGASRNSATAPRSSRWRRHTAGTASTWNAPPICRPHCNGPQRPCARGSRRSSTRFAASEGKAAGCEAALRDGETLDLCCAAIEQFEWSNGSWTERLRRMGGFGRATSELGVSSEGPLACSNHGRPR